MLRKVEQFRRVLEHLGQEQCPRQFGFGDCGRASGQHSVFGYYKRDRDVVWSLRPGVYDNAVSDGGGVAESVESEFGIR